MRAAGDTPPLGSQPPEGRPIEAKGRPSLVSRNSHPPEPFSTTDCSPSSPSGSGVPCGGGLQRAAPFSFSSPHAAHRRQQKVRAVWPWQRNTTSHERKPDEIRLNCDETCVKNWAKARGPILGGVEWSRSGQRRGAISPLLPSSLPGCAR